MQGNNDNAIDCPTSIGPGGDNLNRNSALSRELVNQVQVRQLDDLAMRPTDFRYACQIKSQNACA